MQDSFAETIPGVGQVYSGGKAITAYNPITGQPLTWFEVSLAVLGVVSGGLGDEVGDAARNVRTFRSKPTITAPVGAPISPAVFDLYKSLRTEGLNASEAYAVIARKFTTSQLPDGTFVTTLGRSAHLEARLLDDGVLFIDKTSVTKSLQGLGVSHELFQQTLSSVGANNVRSVQSYFGPGTNLDVVRAGIERGLTPAQAAALTPRGRTVIRFGFTKIDYDPFTGIFSASR